VKFLKYGIFCILVLVASVLIRRPSEVPQEETTPVKSVETSGQVMEAKEPPATTERAEPGAEMIKGQEPSMTTASDDEEDQDDEDDGEDQDDDQDQDDEED
jgi:hypothetical protein